MTLGTLASKASLDKVLHVLGHLRLIVVILEHGISLFHTKVPGKSSPIELLNQEFSNPTLWYAQPVSIEQETIFKVEKTIGMLLALFNDLFEIFILSIHSFDTLETKDLSLQSREEKVPP